MFLAIAIGVSLYVAGWVFTYLYDEPIAYIVMITVTIGGVAFGLCYTIFHTLKAIFG